MKVIKIIIIVFVLLFLIYCVWGIYLSSVSRTHCRVECKIRGTEFFEIVKNNKMNINDGCICWFPDENKFESFIIR